jgi:putative peptidoglycan lipid II flippase
MKNYIKKIFYLSRYSLLSLVALFLGFWRELVVSSHFGLSQELDVYVAILGFYLFFGVQVANTLEMVFISKSAQSKSDGQITAQLFNSCKVLSLVNVIVSIILHYTAMPMIALFFPGFTPEQIQLGSLILDYLIIAIIFANFSGLLRASLNILKIFSPGLLSGATISLVSASAVIFFSDKYGLDALVLGFISGNCIVFCLLLIVFCIRVGWHGLIDGFRQSSNSSGLWKAALIVLLGEICYQGFNMAERSFASTISTGTISSFYYAWTLVAVPLSVVIMPLSTVIYPRLAAEFSGDPLKGFRLLKKYIIPLFLCSLLVVSGVSFLSENIVKIVFMRGNFSQADAEKTAGILGVLIFSLPFSSFGRMVRYGLYSLSDYKSASFCQLLTVITLMLSASPLITRYGAIGLAYASTLAVSIQSISMLILLRLRLNNANT